MLTHPQKDKLTVLGAIYQRSPIILLTIDPEIQSLADLEGKKVNGLTEIEAMLTSAQMLDKVVFSKSVSALPTLLDGTFDAIGAHIADQPRQLQNMNIPFKIFKPEDYAIGFYGECLVASRNEVETNPERAEKMIAASFKGWKYAMDNPEETVALIQKKYPYGDSAETMLQELNVLKNLILPNLFDVGSMNRSRWITMANILEGLDLMEAEFDPNGFIYEPPSQKNVWLPRLLWIFGILILVTSVGALLLVLFNNNLKKAVIHRTINLDKANKELDNFVYSLSHDIRAPLASVLGLVQVARIEPGSEKVYLDLIEKSVHQLDAFLNEILDYSKSTRTGIEPTVLDIDLIIDQVYNELRYQIGAEKITLVKDITMPFPLITDKRRLVVLLRNFISNSIKYHQPNSNNPFVKVSVKTTKFKILFSVSDNGFGIPQEHLDKIYNMFYQASDQVKGSGLGLYIVKETVEGMQGSLQVNSTENVGTKFTVEIPNLRP